jgi:hypothetical protein
MANTYKDIVITPNKGSSTDDPKIVFSGANTSVNTDITLRVYPDSNGTLSFEGTAGQLFSITNDLSGSVFSVNDISGIPLIEVNPTNQQITLGQFYGNVGIGTANSSNYKLDVTGGANISLPNLTVGGTNVIAAIVASNANAVTLSTNVNTLAATFVAANANNVSLSANINTLAATFTLSNANTISLSTNVNTLAAAFVSNSQTLSANVNTLAATFTLSNANTISLSTNVNVLAAAFVSNSQTLSSNVNVLAATVPANTASGRYLGTSNNTNYFDGYDSIDFEGYFLNTIDMTALSNTTYYPVTMQITGGTFPRGSGNYIRFKLETRLNSGFVPSWATHPNGFTIQLDWEVAGSGYGTVSSVERIIRSYTETWTSATICGGIEQMTNTSQEVIYLRGGGKYYLYSSRAVTPNIRTTSFTDTLQTVSPSATTNNNIWSAATATVGLYSAYFASPSVTIGGTNVISSLVSLTTNTQTLSANVNTLAAATVANDASQGANIATLAASFVSNSQTLSANVNTLAATFSLSNANTVSLSTNVNTLAAAFVSNSQSLSANVNTLAATFVSANANNVSLSANINTLAATFSLSNANTVSLSTNVNTLAAAFVSNSQSLSANVNTLAATFSLSNANTVSLSTNVNTLAASFVSNSQSLSANVNVLAAGLPGKLSNTSGVAFAGSLYIPNNSYLYFYPGAGAGVRMAGINNTNTAYIGPIDFGPTSVVFNASSTSNAIAFYTQGSEQIRIDASGNVGIGLVSPTNKLHVNGNATVNNFIEYSQTIAVNYTIGTNRNALTAGPVTINSGVTVTVPTGSYWTIV